MKENCIKTIRESTEGHPKRWREVLETTLIHGDTISDQKRFLTSAIAIHSKFPESLEIAEAVLAGDAFVPLAIASLLDSSSDLKEIDSFLKQASEQIETIHN